MNDKANNGVSAIMNKIQEYNEELDLREKMSLVFLMCDDALKAHCFLKTIIDEASKQNNIMTELFCYLKNFDQQNVFEKFVESLILIGNHKLVLSLGYNKSEVEKLKESFKIHNKKCYINFVRKTLYKMCEKMSVNELTGLISLVENEFKEIDIHFTHHCSREMEMNLLYWINIGYLSDGTGIKECDVSNLIKHLQKMNRYDLIKELENMHVNNYVSIKEDSDLMYPDNDFLERSYPLEGTPLKTVVPKGEDRYDMDKNNMGLCIIVNQRNFSRECLTEEEVPFLNVRHGTDHDRDKLDLTFLGLGYEVLVLENLDSNSLRQSIRKIVREKVCSSHSSLILCILSHGKRDAILCVDGREILVEEMENMVLGEECPQLLGKPKIIIIQACQGSTFQRALPCSHNTDDNCSMLESDGPTKTVIPVAIPPKADLFTFWATVPGFASLRSVTSGSVFIQTFCDELLKRGNSEHFSNIVTKVNDKMSKSHFQEDKKVVMSYIKHTATRKLFFPYSAQYKCKAAKKMYEKNLIDTLIKLCIITTAAENYSLQQHRNMS